MSTGKYPIDFDDYGLGDTIPAALIETAYGVRREDVKRYQLAVRRMVDACRLALEQRGVLSPTVAQRGDDVVILAPTEATEYNWKNDRIAKRRQRRLFRQMSAVDVSALPPEKRKEHTFRHARMGAELEAQRKAGTAFLLANTKRITPNRGLETNNADHQRNDQGTVPAAHAQLAAGQSAGPGREGDEADHLEAQEDGR